MTAKILSQVNSSHYGLAHQVDDLSHAISLLGPKEIRTLAQTLNCAPLFSEKDEHPSFSRKELWRHCVVVGQIAQHIGELIGHGEPGVFYTAGVLHDLGWALMDQSLKRHFHQVLEQIESGAERSAAEVEVFTFDHTQLGAFVSEKWNLPAVVTAAIQHHHDPAGYAGDHQAVVNGVAIANYFADQNGASSLKSATVTFPGDDVFLAIGLGAKQSQSILEEIPSLIEKATQLSSNAAAS